MLPLKQQLQISEDANDYEFLLKWSGLPLYEATWEPYSHLRFCNEHLEDFIDSHDLPEHWKVHDIEKKAT